MHRRLVQRRLVAAVGCAAHGRQKQRSTRQRLVEAVLATAAVAIERADRRNVMRRVGRQHGVLPALRDLSQLKVGKKTPLTLSHFGFAPDGAVLDEDALPAALVADWQADEANAGKPFPSYARQLARRGTPDADSRWSWTVDFAARRAEAREAMQPLLDSAAQLKSEVVDLKEQLKRRKKEKAAVDVVAALEAQIRDKDKAARDLEAQASVIDAAVFDLKAVNPNAVAAVDDRTPAEIIASIGAQGHIVTQSLARLSALLRDDAQA